jgi:hypothetical protein
VQTAVRLDTPVLNTGATGFTSVTASGLGGTVTPSGSAHIADGTRFVIQIQTGGAVGTATFKTSVDGGNTYGALQTTAASMTDATSGITLTFSGTFTANGTAAFRSAFTPQAQWSDQAGNIRSYADHIGYPMGRFTNWVENWDWFIGVSGVQSLSLPSANYLKWSYSSSANSILGTIGDGAGPTTSSSYLKNQLATPANGNTSRLISGIAPLVTYSGLSMACEFEIGGTATGAGAAGSAAFKVGWFNQAAATIAAGDYGIGIVKQGGDSTWKVVTCNNGVSTSQDTALSCIDGSFHRVRLELHGNTSPYGAQTAFFFVDGKPFSSTTNLPFASVGLLWVVSNDCVGSSLTASVLEVGPVHACWNRSTAGTAAMPIP